MLTELGAAVEARPALYCFELPREDDGRHPTVFHTHCKKSTERHRSRGAGTTAGTRSAFANLFVIYLFVHS